MKDNKRTANIVDGNKMLCRTCNEFRELRYFRRSQVDNKCYYTTKKCKVCLGITINENKYENDQYIKPVPSKLSDECLLFLERRSEEHTSELQSRFGISYAVFCLTKKNLNQKTHHSNFLK